MNWTELIERVAVRSGTSVSQTRAVLTAAIDEIVESLADGEGVVLWGLGSLEDRWVESRTVRSISDGRKLRLDGRYVARFRPAARLREALQKRTPQLWKHPDHQKAWKVAETLVSDLALYHAARAPSLDADAEPRSIQDACSSSFGPLWARVRQTYETQVPPEVRQTADYLALAARSRWGREL
ncbi:MAG: HU family DNA-binding protein [Alphaproteobacteria bacterium]|nr:HU family DNA-binding protein [Alphaproteobacteria bacterium]